MQITRLLQKIFYVVADGIVALRQGFALCWRRKLENERGGGFQGAGPQEYLGSIRIKGRVLGLCVLCCVCCVVCVCVFGVMDNAVCVRVCVFG